jgi:hypothetical protein
MNMNEYFQSNYLSNLIETAKQYVPCWTAIKRETKAYLVDTSAKVGTYAVPMGIMEASRGLSLEQIVQSRTSVALADAVLGRLYGKALNYTRRKTDTEGKTGIKSYVVDTATMLAVYDPAYMLILKSTGANLEQIESATLWLTGILMLTARPFSKHVLDKWRKKWKTR